MRSSRWLARRLRRFACDDNLFPELSAVCVVSQNRGIAMSQHHTIACRPNNCHWGFFDAALDPVATLASGDTVAVDCVSGGRDILPTDPSFEILADHRAIHGALLSVGDGHGVQGDGEVCVTALET